MSRRTTLLGSLVVTGAILLAACGDDDPSSSSPATTTTAPATAPATGWSYVDGSGKETTLDEVPSRIVAHGRRSGADPTRHPPSRDLRRHPIARRSRPFEDLDLGDGNRG